MKSKEELEQQLRAACQIVETYARSIGPDCEIIFTANGVQVAPLSWSGDVFADTLYDALKEARQSVDDE